MQTFVVYVLLCAATTAPQDCDQSTAISTNFVAETHSELTCGLGTQEALALTGQDLKDGQYIKIQCIKKHRKYDQQ